MEQGLVVVNSVSIKEHESLSEAVAATGFLDSCSLLEPREVANGSKPYLFDLGTDGRVGFFIGLDWLVENKLAVEVNPKIDGLDYMAMFSACLNNPVCRPHLGRIYHVDWNRSLIPAQRQRNDLTTIVAVHFLLLLADLLEKPLKKGYVTREENLQSRIKGKILMGRHITANVLGMRPDRVYCAYQEYSEDCLENRLLHTALVHAKRHLSQQEYSLPVEIQSSVSAMENRLSDIGFISSPSELDKVKFHPLFPEYGEALKLARMLYRKTGYRAEVKIDARQLVPPFVIDMSLLFELYCLHHLEKSSILAGSGKGRFDYQYTIRKDCKCDFLDLSGRRILDAKYKKRYDSTNTPSLDDLRQLSGYARDEDVFKRLRIKDDSIIPCVILFPSKSAREDLVDWDQPDRLEEMNGYRHFYRVGLKLPITGANA